MSEYIHLEEHIGGVILKIIADNDPESPREWCNLGTMVCDHGRHNLGDKGAHDRAADAIRASRAYRDTWEDSDGDALDFSRGPDLWEAIQRCSDIVSLPLYLYDHSGLRMSTGRFSCPWDSGQVGFTFVTKADILNEYGGTILSKSKRAKAEEVLRGEVETYDQFLSGDVWGYVVETHDGEDIDSCWGLYGADYCEREGRAVAESYRDKYPIPESEEVDA